MTFEQLVAHLSASGQGRTRSARCPNHSDTAPSLRISEGDDGKLLVKCMARCDTKDVLAAAGLGWADLFPDTHDARPGVVAHYYYSEDLRKTRLEPKSFRAERYEAGKGWVPAWNGIRPPLYGIDKAALAGSATVFVVEGEKDVDRLATLGYTAISAPHGAGERQIAEKYCDDLLRLKDRDFVLVGDNDPPGFALVEEWAKALQPFAKTIRHLDWRGQVPVGGDVSDYFDLQHTLDDFEELLKQSVSIPVSRLPLERETRNERRSPRLRTLRELFDEPDVQMSFLADGLLVAGNPRWS